MATKKKNVTAKTVKKIEKSEVQTVEAKKKAEAVVKAETAGNAEGAAGKPVAKAAEKAAVPASKKGSGKAAAPAKKAAAPAEKAGKAAVESAVPAAGAAAAKKAEPVKKAAPKKAEAKAEVKAAPKAEKKAEPVKAAPKAAEKKVEAKPAVKEAPKAEVKAAPKAEAKPVVKEAVKAAEKKAEAKPAVKEAPKAEEKAAPKAEAKPVVKEAVKAEVKEAPKAEVKAAPKAETKAAPKAEAKAEPAKEEKKAPAKKAAPKKAAAKKAEPVKEEKKAAAKKAALKKAAPKKTGPTDAEKQASYDAYELNTCIDMAKAMGIDMNYDDYAKLLMAYVTPEEIVTEILKEYPVDEKKFDFEEDGYDLSLLPALIKRIGDGMDVKASSFKDLADKINAALDMKLTDDGMHNADVYNTLFDLVRQVLMLGQNRDYHSIAEMNEFIPADLEALIVRFMDTAYAVLPTWQYKDVKYYKDFLYAVLSQFEDLHAPYDNRAMMDVADLLIRHGDYGLGDAEYNYVLRENQLKDQIYYRFANIYRSIDNNKAKAIANDALRIIDGRYDYYPKIIEILEN